MKTNQILQRKMGNFDVLQRTSDGMFNATYLLKQWNAANPTEERRIDNFWLSTHLAELMNEIIENEPDVSSLDSRDDNVSLNINELKKQLTKTSKANKGVNSGTWMHPILYIKFAMYLSPRFEYHVLKFVSDQLLQYRNDAGDAYKEMAEAVVSIVPKDENVMKSIKYVAHAVNIVVWGKHEKDIRNKQAEEGKMRDLLELEKDVAKLIKKKFIKNINQLREYLLQEYRDRHEPKLLTV